MPRRLEIAGNTAKDSKIVYSHNEDPDTLVILEKNSELLKRIKEKGLILTNFKSVVDASYSRAIKRLIAQNVNRESLIKKGC